MFKKDNIAERVKELFPWSILMIVGIVIFCVVMYKVNHLTEVTENINSTTKIMKEMTEAQETTEEATSNVLSTASLEELINEIEERTSTPTMETICLKLESYAKSLNDEVRFGVVTLSEEEMKVLREYVKNNFDKATGRFSDYYILGTDEVISGLGVSQYEDYKFILELRRQLTFIGPEFRKPVVIANSIDHPDKNIKAFKIISGELSDGYIDGERFDLIKTHSYSYTYYRDAEKVIIEKWKFGEKLEEWSCSAWKSDNVWYGAPKSLYWHEDDGEYSLIAENHLLLARNGKITVLAEGMDYDTEVVQLQDNDALFFYIKDEELHAVNKDTLEDNVVTEDYQELYKRLS